jgi:hypothetical protein
VGVGFLDGGVKLGEDAVAGGEMEEVFWIEVMRARFAEDSFEFFASLTVGAGWDPHPKIVV